MVQNEGVGHGGADRDPVAVVHALLVCRQPGFEQAERELALHVEAELDHAAVSDPETSLALVLLDIEVFWIVEGTVLQDFCSHNPG